MFCAREDDVVLRADFDAEDVAVGLAPFLEFEKGLFGRDLERVAEDWDGWWAGGEVGWSSG